LTQQGEACKAHSAGRPGLRSSPSRAPHPRRRRRAGRAREGGQRQLVLGDQERRPAHLRARFRLSERGRAPARRRTCTAGALGARYSEEASRTRCCRVEGFTDSQAGPGLALAAVRRRRRCAAGSRRGCAGRGAHLVAHVARALQQRRERRRARAGRLAQQARLCRPACLRGRWRGPCCAGAVSARWHAAPPSLPPAAQTLTCGCSSFSAGITKATK